MVRPKNSVRQPVSLRQIEDAAAKIFRREGYRSATMEQIAEEVGLHKTSLYHHIKSKEALLVSLAEVAVGDSIVRLRSLVADADLGACAKLGSAVEAHVLMTAERTGALTAFTLYAHQIGDVAVRDRYLEARKEYSSLMLTLVSSALAVHSRDDDPGLVVFGILGMCNWMQHWYSPDGRSRAEDIASEFSGMALRMVGCIEA